MIRTEHPNSPPSLRNLSLLRAAAALRYWWSFGSFCHRFRFFTPHPFFDPGNKVLTDFDAKACEFINNFLGRGVHPNSGECASNRFLFVGCQFGPSVIKRRHISDDILILD